MKLSGKPEILAPAGDQGAFLAALAAGADAVYLGLKSFSARMAAKNFSMADLGALAQLARERETRVFVAMNTLAKPGDPVSAGRLMDKLARHVAPDALILSDPGLASLAREAGFSGEIHLSTLANISHPRALAMVRENLAADRVILPRELSIDEIKAMAAACPEGLGLEVFVHGALCYGVSGRCYWSSMMGGKSGLRGRCVQPCRRVYTHNRKKMRLFSCQDLGLDVLVKTLLEIPQIKSWKIEGRKKGPHYVYHATRAYRTLRDHGSDPAAKKEALDLLARALGRPTTHYGFLPQRAFVPIRPDEPTGSGMRVGFVTQKPGRGPFIRAQESLYPGDLVRVGYEDEPGHCTLPVRERVGRGKTLKLPSPGARRAGEAPVFLIDRRDPRVMAEIRELSESLKKIPRPAIRPGKFEPREPRPAPSARMVVNMHLHRDPKEAFAAKNGVPALWVDPGRKRLPAKALVKAAWWWLPPVVWPDGEEQIAQEIQKLLKAGAGRFVLNAPWQTAFFPKGSRLAFLAGPFCNVANAKTLEVLANLGFSGAVTSPELAREDFLALPSKSPLPLGIVVAGRFPVCVSRTLAHEVRPDTPFTSQRGELFWVHTHGPDHYVFSGRALSLLPETRLLKKAGYAYFIHMHEPLPKAVPESTRTTKGNWNLKLL